MSDLIFYVKSRSGQLVPARFLTYNGQYISDPNAFADSRGAGDSPMTEEVYCDYR